MSSRKRRTINKVPPIKTRIETFSKEISKWKSEGYEIASKEKHDRRLECCKRCEFYQTLPLGGICLKCGCFSIKLWLQTTKCPINKW